MVAAEQFGEARWLELPSLTIIELLREKDPVVDYNGPYFPAVGATAATTSWR